MAPSISHTKRSASGRVRNPEDKGNGAEDLEQCDQRSHNTGSRHAHVGECAGDTGETEDEQLLITVAEEYRPDSDTKHRQPEAQTARRRRAKEYHRLTSVNV